MSMNEFKILWILLVIAFCACNDEPDLDCIISNPIEIPFNGVDDDCNPLTLDNDADQDGYSVDDDCDENAYHINPGQVEVPFNGIDDDCDPTTLDNDADQDGYSVEDDCDETNPDINPGEKERYYNGIDDDCDPSTPDDDVDQDGYLHTEDCNDFDPLVNPDINDNTVYDCNNKIGWSELQNRRCDCYKNPILTSEEIKENLLGTWELLAIKPEWDPKVYYSCLKLKISTDSITIDNLYTGIEQTVAYEFITAENGISKLDLEDPELERTLGPRHYCKNLMFGTGGWADGDIYFYQKVE